MVKIRWLTSDNYSQKDGAEPFQTETHSSGRYPKVIRLRHKQLHKVAVGAVSGAMAKLHSYFVVCPLLDRRGFLGTAPARAPAELLVTLARNVVNKYRLTDQKQIGGWTSKDHISAAVVYDREQDQYVGVFNNNVIKMWKDDTANLEKVKKYKFPNPILKIICNGDVSIVVFVNGTCASLQYAVENRKVCEEKSILKSGDTILDVTCYNAGSSEHICYIIQNSKGEYAIVSCPLQSDLGDPVRSKAEKHKISRPEPDVRIVGKVMCVEGPPTVYILWSDAKIYAFDLTKSTWKSCGTVPWISTKSTVSMEWMGDKHLILFGSDLDEDGAVIVAFNVALGVGSCRYPMKIYCENAKLYCFNERLILEAGNHLGMLPYALETSRSLSSLLATHEIAQDECTELADWGVGAVLVCDTEGECQELLSKGMTEQSICAQILPPLMVSSDSARVLQVVKQFNDVPEDIIVKLFQYAIKLYSHNNVDLQSEIEFKKFCQSNLEQCNFLNHIFCLPFSDAVLIPYLRDGLSLKDALFLLMYISHLLEDESDEETFSVDYETKILDWCALLLDAFYQQYLISKDQMVTSSLSYTQSVVIKLIERLDEITRLLPILNRVLNQNQKSNDIEDSLSYSIEIMKF